MALSPREVAGGDAVEGGLPVALGAGARHAALCLGAGGAGAEDGAGFATLLPGGGQIGAGVSGVCRVAGGAAVLGAVFAVEVAAAAVANGEREGDVCGHGAPRDGHVCLRVEVVLGVALRAACAVLEAALGTVEVAFHGFQALEKAGGHGVGQRGGGGLAARARAAAWSAFEEGVRH